MTHSCGPRALRATPLRVAAFALLTVLWACGEGPTDPALGRTGEVGVVLNSVDVTLTLFDPDAPGTTRTVVLAPDASPVGVAVRGELAAVPLGLLSSLAVVDLESGDVLRSVALPEGSGATGAAFLDDSVVLVANPGLNSVSPVNVRSGTVGTAIPVGRYPQGIVVAGERVGVLNAELGPDYTPDGPGTVTVLDRTTLDVLWTVQLSGTNPGDAAVGADGTVYLVDSGTFGAGDGSLSVVDLAAGVEVSHHPGFGEFPFAAALSDDGLLYVGSFAYGLAVWSPEEGAFVRSPADALTPEGVPSVSGVALDGEGRLYTLRPDCTAPSVANRLGPAYAVEARIATGTCPIDIAFGGGTGS